MVKRCIGIDVGPSYLCAVQVLRIGKAFCVEKVFDTQARRDTDSASETLRTLVGKHGFDRRAAVSISLPGDAVFFRSVETDSAGLEQVREAGYSVFENDFPIEADELVALPCSYRQTADDKYCILTAAASRQSLREMRDIVLGARMQPSMIGAPVFSIHSTVALNHPEIRTGVAIIAHVTESCLTLAITEILIVRHFPIEGGSGEDGDSVEDRAGEVLLREAGITWRKLFDTEIAQDIRIYLAGAGEKAAGLGEIIEENLHDDRCQSLREGLVETRRPFASRHIRRRRSCVEDVGAGIHFGHQFPRSRRRRRKIGNELQEGDGDLCGSCRRDCRRLAGRALHAQVTIGKRIRQVED